jgi:hypothetical protein
MTRRLLLFYIIGAATNKAEQYSEKHFSYRGAFLFEGFGLRCDGAWLRRSLSALQSLEAK